MLGYVFIPVSSIFNCAWFQEPVQLEMLLASPSLMLPEGQISRKEEGTRTACPLSYTPTSAPPPGIIVRIAQSSAANTAIDEVVVGAVPQLASRTAIVVAIPQLHDRSPCVNDLSEPRAVNNNNTDLRGAPTDENSQLPHGTAPAAEERYIGRCDTLPREVFVDVVICRGQERLRNFLGVDPRPWGYFGGGWNEAIGACLTGFLRRGIR
jgi:hypothetical protein